MHSQYVSLKLTVIPKVTRRANPVPAAKSHSASLLNLLSVPPMRPTLASANIGLKLESKIFSTKFMRGYAIGIPSWKTMCLTVFGSSAIALNTRSYVSVEQTRSFLRSALWKEQSVGDHS